MPIPIQNVKPNVVATITPSQPNVVANLTPSSPTVAGVLNNPISTQPSGVLKMVQNTTPTPTLDPNLMQRVQATNGTLNANKNFINAVYKAYLGVDAPQNILDQYYGKPVDEVRTGIGGLTPSGRSSYNTDIQAPVDASNIQNSAFEYPDYNDMISDPTAFMGSYGKLYEGLNKPTDEITGLEKKSTDIEQTIMDLTKTQLGKSDRLLELEEKYGTAGLQLKISEITNRINQKVAEYNLINEKLSQGTGLTSVIQGKQALTKRMLAAETAVLSAENAVYQGQLDTADDLIARAIDLEFGDIEARIEAAKTFYDINQNKLTKAEQKQADKNTAILDAYSTLLTEQKEDKKSNYELAKEIWKKGLPGDLVDMNRSAEENLMFVGPLLEEQNQGLVNSLSEEQLSLMNNIQSDVFKDPDIKGYIDIRDSYNRIIASAKDPSAAGDMALIFNYMKVLDPGSTVREGEFATAQNSAGVPEIIRAQYNKVMSGKRLSTSQRDDFVDRAKKLYAPKYDNYLDAIDFYKNKLMLFGIPEELVLRDYSGGVTSGNTLDEAFGGFDFGSLDISDF